MGEKKKKKKKRFCFTNSFKLYPVNREKPFVTKVKFTVTYNFS